MIFQDAGTLGRHNLLKIAGRNWRAMLIQKAGFVDSYCLEQDIWSAK
jgi:hypothetical protein